MTILSTVSVTFTYRADYDPTSIVEFGQNALDDFTDRSSTLGLGPDSTGRFVMVGSWDTTSDGITFEDADREVTIGDYTYLATIDTLNYAVFADFTGNTGLVSLTGGVYGDILVGGSGDDALSGGAGSDVLSGGSGFDTIDGGAGTDTVSYDALANGVTVSLLGGTGMDQRTWETDELSGIENIRGTAYDDSLVGNSGNNVIEGGSGNDTLTGEAGSDTISYEHLSELVYVDLSASFASKADALGVDFLTGFENIYGTAHDDTLMGNSGNNIIEGGAGADSLSGLEGVNTASYSHSAAGVTVDLRLTTQVSDGDASGDVLTEFTNLYGSAFADSLTGDSNANTLTGNGGGDTLVGLAGNDRLVITESPASVDGGDDTDLLFVQGGGSIVLTDDSFRFIEKTYVRDGTTLDMTGVGTDGDTTGSVIISQSTAGYSVLITGSQDADTIIGGKGSDTLAGGVGADRITAGSGGATIDGGAGGDRLFGGAGADTFIFAETSGRDNLYSFTVGTDMIDVSAFVDNYDDIILTAIHGGRNTLVTFVGDTDPTHKIIIHDVLKAALTEASFMIGGV